MSHKAAALAPAGAFSWYMYCTNNKKYCMKTMFLAATIVGVTIAGLLIVAGKKISGKTAKRDREIDYSGDGQFPERSALQTMG